LSPSLTRDTTTQEKVIVEILKLPDCTLGVLRVP
jgi:hypothetical protein